MKYQLVVVVDPKEEEKKAQGRITTLLEKEGFTVSAGVSWGKKMLAYPIKKRTEGFYFSFTLTGDHLNPMVVTEKFKLDETILRSLVLRREERKKSQKSKVKSQN